jgi:hypothetical protein
MRLSDDHATWLIAYCQRHGLPVAHTYARHCVAIAEANGATDANDLDTVYGLAIEEIQRAQYAHSQAVIAGLHAPAMKTGA